MNLLPLPKETPARVRFFNDVFGVNRQLEFSVGEDRFQLRFDPAAESSHSGSGIQVSGTESGELIASLSETSVLPGLRTWLHSAALEDVTEELAAIIVDAYVSDTFAALASQLGETFDVTKFWTSVPDRKLEYRLPFWLSNATGQRVRGTLQFESSWAPTIQALLSRAPAVASRTLDALRISLPIELGRSSLSIAEIRDLQQLDVVLLEETEFLSHQRVTVLFPGPRKAVCRIEDSKLVVEQVDAQARVEPTTARDVVDTSEIALPLSVRSGHVEATLGQVRKLASGDEFNVPTSSSPFVDFIVADQRGGHGELIRNRNRLGVRLMSLREGPVQSLLMRAGATATSRSG